MEKVESKSFKIDHLSILNTHWYIPNPTHDACSKMSAELDISIKNLFFF